MATTRTWIQFPVKKASPSRRPIRAAISSVGSKGSQASRRRHNDGFWKTTRYMLDASVEEVGDWVFLPVEDQARNGDARPPEAAQGLQQDLALRGAIAAQE